MEFGMFDQTEQPGGLATGNLYESRLALAELAERSGFWGYHKSEHHMIPLDHAPSIGLFLAALSQRTSTLRLCSLVHLLPFYHPIRLLEEISMLDHLSGGRFELGFGKGVSVPEHILWGLDADEAVARTEEMLALLVAAFTSEGAFSFDGDFWTLDRIPMEIRPLQTPYPPLWRPGQLDHAAELGVSTIVAGPTDTAAASIERYRELQQPGLSAGRDPRIGVLRRYVLAPTDAEADELGRRTWAAFTHNLTVLFRRFEIAPPNDPTLGGDYELAKQVNAVVVGSPARVHDHVAELAGTGVVDYAIGCFAFGDLTHDEAARSIELFAEHVMPDFAASPS